MPIGREDSSQTRKARDRLPPAGERTHFLKRLVIFVLGLSARTLTVNSLQAVKEKHLNCLEVIAPKGGNPAYVTLRAENGARHSMTNFVCCVRVMCFLFYFLKKVF